MWCVTVAAHLSRYSQNIEMKVWNGINCKVCRKPVTASSTIWAPIGAPWQTLYAHKAAQVVTITWLCGVWQSSPFLLYVVCRVADVNGIVYTQSFMHQSHLSTTNAWASLVDLVQQSGSRLVLDGHSFRLRERGNHHLSLLISPSTRHENGDY